MLIKAGFAEERAAKPREICYARAKHNESVYDARLGSAGDGYIAGIFGGFLAGAVGVLIDH